FSEDGTLADNDTPALSLTAASAATEGNDIQLTVTSDIAIATTAPDIGFTLTFAPRSSSGITGADFGGNYADLTQALTGVAFTGGSRTTATVPVATVNDALYEGDEDYTATLSAPTGATLDTDNSEDGTLTDNDTPALSLQSASDAAEGSPVSLTIKSSRTFAAQAVWNVVIAFSGTGIEAADFDDNVLSRTVSVTFAAGEDTATVPVTTQNDTVYEGDENYTATLSAASAALYTVTSSSTTASGTITDNDTPALSLTAASAATEGDNIQLTVTSNIAIAATAPDIGFTLTFAARSGSGITGADFTNGLMHALTEVKFTGGSDTIATVPIATVDDTAYEGNEGYTATLSAASAALYTVTSSNATASGTLTDNDAPALSLTAASPATEGGNIQLTVTSNIAIAATAPDIGFTLTFAARSGSGITGADFGGNYADLTHVLTELEFNGGEIAMVEIATVDDAIYEGNEDYTATLSVPTGAMLDTDAAEDGTLADNDTPALSLTAASTATEGEAIQLTVTSNIAIAATAPNIGFTLTFAARSGSGITGADFTNGLTHTLTGVAFTGGSRTTATVPVATVNDTLYEGDEDYTATLSVPTGATLGSDFSEDGTLADNNDAPALSLQSASDAEEGSPVSLTIKSSRTFAAQTVWNVVIAFSGTGIEAADFADDTLSHTVSVTFAAGADTATVPMATQNDTVYEGDEYYTATLSAASAALYTVTSSSATASGTITDNDTPTLSLSGGGEITEGENVALTVTSNIAFSPTAPAPVARLTVAGSEVSNADFSGDWNSGTDDVSLNFSNMTAPVSIPSNDDTILERSEGYTVTLTAVARQGYTVNTSSNSAIGTINDNDGIRIQAGQTSVDAAEGGAVNVVLEAV
ncbi:MAG: beta strand repeat-containing protein, partial [Candidatus Eutrophobiaceae bacterium]